MPYIKQLRKAYHLEVIGEAFYATAARLTKAPSRVAQWNTLMKLETQTRQRIELAIEALDDSVNARKVDVWVGSAFGALLALLPRRLSLKLLRAVTDHSVGYWEDLARMSSGRNNALHQYLIEHERAQCDFAKSELEGNSNEAMLPVHRLLDV